MKSRGYIKSFRHKKFFKSADCSNLRDLLIHLGVLACDGLIMALKVSDRDLAIRCYEQLQIAERDRLDGVLTLINDFDSDEGMKILVSAADELGIERENQTALNLAILLYIKNDFQFTMRHRCLCLQSAKSRQEYSVKPAIPLLEIKDEQLEAMREAFSANLKLLEYGKQIQVEAHIYENFVAITFWTEDYSKVVSVFEEKGQIEQKILRPVIESTLLYYPSEGRLRLKAVNNELMNLSRKTFAQFCLNFPTAFEGPNSRKIWDLERFKHMRHLTPNPATGITTAEIIAIKVKASDFDKETIEICQFEGTLYEASLRRGLTLSQVRIQKIGIRFKLQLGKGKPLSRTVYLSAPHGSNLEDREPDRLIERQLQEWGILLGAQPVLQMA